jgi:hypothetical protein
VLEDFAPFHSFVGVCEQQRERERELDKKGKFYIIIVGKTHNARLLTHRIYFIFTSFFLGMHAKRTLTTHVEYYCVPSLKLRVDVAWNNKREKL